jgi:lipopolysaccharide transport protein LptA
MANFRPLKEKFVHITQPRFKVRSRRVDLEYGSVIRELHLMTAFEDVFLQEVGELKSLRYGTSGRADFDTKRNVIILKDFPQVYQDQDTVTGDVIIMHRDSDIVEVEQSNAFNDGK